MGGLVDRAGGADHDRVWGGGVMLDGEAPWQEGAGRTAARNHFRFRSGLAFEHQVPSGYRMVT